MSIIKHSSTRFGRLALAAGITVILGFAPSAFANDIVALKNALYGAGYNITNVNPGMDDNTRNELTRFQKENGLQANGILDEATKKALGMVRVDVAAATAISKPAKNQAAAPGEPEPEKEEVIEEKEDGGWSFF